MIEVKEFWQGKQQKQFKFKLLMPPIQRTLLLAAMQTPLSNRDAALLAFSLIRDKENNPVKLTDAKIPPDSYLCIDGMGDNGELRGNFPLNRTPLFEDLRYMGWTLQNRSYECFVLLVDTPEMPKGYIQLTNQKNWDKNNNHTALDWVLSWLNHPHETFIDTIEDPEAREMARKENRERRERERMEMQRTEASTKENK